MNLSSFYKEFKTNHFDWFDSSSVKKDLNIYFRARYHAMPHLLTEINKLNRVSAAVSLLGRLNK